MRGLGKAMGNSRESGNLIPHTWNAGVWRNQAARRFLSDCCLQRQTGVWVPAFAGMTDWYGQDFTLTLFLRENENEKALMDGCGIGSSA